MPIILSNPGKRVWKGRLKTIGSHMRGEMPVTLLEEAIEQRRAKLDRDEGQVQ